MDYKVTIDNFDGPLDLLLHLIKSSDIDIYDISIEEISKQYLDYIQAMKELNLDVASEYLVMASELMVIKSMLLLPQTKLEDEDYEEDPREQLIQRLIEYKQYKELVDDFKTLEEERKKTFSKESSDLQQYKRDNDEIDLGDTTLDDLILAFQKFLERKQLDKPLNTTITKKEYSIQQRSREIKDFLKVKKNIEFSELFPQYNLISGTFSMLFGEGGVVPFRSVYIVVPENIGDQVNVICLCIKIAAVGAT